MEKKIQLQLAGLDGNAFFLLGAFSRQARREGWTRADIDAVLQDAQSGDYDHLLQVLIAHCDTPDDYEDDDEEDDDEDIPDDDPGFDPLFLF